MHSTAMDNCQKFHDTYLTKIENGTVVEIGSKNENGTPRGIFPNWKYIGIDMSEGPCVDIVAQNEYDYPVEDETADVLISTSTFEHSEFFWASFMEGIRILKPHGLFYINAPTKCLYHPYPGDSWRFYPDAGRSLSNWANIHDMKTVLLESYISHGDQNDFVAIILKDEKFLDDYPDRIIEKHPDFWFNGRNNKVNLTGDLLNPNHQWSH